MGQIKESNQTTSDEWLPGSINCRFFQATCTFSSSMKNVHYLVTKIRIKLLLLLLLLLLSSSPFALKEFIDVAQFISAWSCFVYE